MKKHVLVSILLVVVLLSGAIGVATWMILTRRGPQREQPRRQPATVLAPPLEALENHTVRIVGYGSARPKVRLQIAPQVAGEVVYKAPNFLTGEYVQRGQLLLEIDKTDYVQARDAALRQIDLLQTRLKRLDQEEANLQASEKIERRRTKLAERKLADARKLLAQGAAGQNDVDNAEDALLLHEAQLQTILSQLALIDPQRRQFEADIAVTKVQLAQAETSIGRTKLRSPVTGRVLGCDVEVGERFAVGQACGELYGTEVMEVPVPIPAGDLEWIEGVAGATSAPAAGKAGADAEVVWQQPDNGRTLRWRGKVGRIEAGLAAQTRTATVVVEVINPAPGKGEGVLDMNMFCRVTIRGRTLARAFILPRQAILPDQSVYVVNSGRLAKRTVRLARLAGAEAMLLPGGGVAAGDRIIIGYVPKPVPGMRVEAIDSLDAASGPASRPAERP